uniref:Ig-like domain-containing protein n=1 Tax=Zonotrichia albicollis TaxID=44394 RepID=A0A8D2MB91_ZONAL
PWELLEGPAGMLGVLSGVPLPAKLRVLGAQGIAVLWDRVTLTCQGLGTTSATTWYKDGWHWGQQGHDCLTVTENGTYSCDRPGSGLSPPMRVLDGEGDWLVLQVPARPLLEGDRVTLRCRDRWNNLGHWVSFYHEEKHLVQLRNGTELTLFPLQLHHSGRYRCRGWLTDRQWVVSAPVTVTVHSENPTVSTPTPPQSHPKDLGSLSPLCSKMSADTKFFLSLKTHPVPWPDSNCPGKGGGSGASSGPL